MPVFDFARTDEQRAKLKVFPNKKREKIKEKDGFTRKKTKKAIEIA